MDFKTTRKWASAGSSLKDTPVSSYHCLLNYKRVIHDPSDGSRNLYLGWQEVEVAWTRIYTNILAEADWGGKSF